MNSTQALFLELAAGAPMNPLYLARGLVFQCPADGNLDQSQQPQQQPGAGGTFGPFNPAGAANPFGFNGGSGFFPGAGRFPGPAGGGMFPGGGNFFPGAGGTRRFFKK